MFTAASCKIDRHPPKHIMLSYSCIAFTLGPHDRPESDYCVGAREKPNERVAKKGVIQLVIRPPLTNEMISECPKLASASCDNWMVMYAPNAYTANARADADLPCVFPLVKGLNACKCPHSWLVWSHHGGTYSDTHGDSKRQRFSIDDYTSFRREINRRRDTVIIMLRIILMNIAYNCNFQYNLIPEIFPTRYVSKVFANY